MASHRSVPISRYQPQIAMSDKTLLLNLEELIDLCFGPSGTDIANFKVMEIVLYQLARQMRLLEQDVEIKFDDDEDMVNLSISEVSHKAGKGSTILIATKPASRDSKDRLGQINVVTRSKFDILKADVDELMTVKALKPIPSLPDNKQMREDLASGSATLPEAMEATQLNARIKETEDQLTRMANLLTELAAMGAFPADTLDLFTEFVQKQQNLADFAVDSSQETISSVSHISVGIDSKSATFATKPDLDAAIENMERELKQSIGQLTDESTKVVERARNLANTIEEKLKLLLEKDEHIKTLNSLTTDYANQLSGFNTGVSIQLLNFQEQMTKLLVDQKEGIDNLDSLCKAETIVMLELRNQHDVMRNILKESKALYEELLVTQDEITKEVKNQLDWLEMLRENKADREEVEDGLRDKADLCRIDTFVSEDAFEKTYRNLLIKLNMSYDKFKRQDGAWLNVISDLTELANNKADLIQFWELRDNTANEFTQIQADLLKIEIMLGAPKAAILTRHLSRDTHDKTRMVPELMVPCIDSGKTPLDVRTLDYPVGDGPCLKEIRMKPTEDRKMFYKRWVGGSHTMLTEYTTHEQAQPLRIQITPTKHYSGYGTDKRLYMLEEELQPCNECNQLLKKGSQIEVVGGDQGPRDTDIGIEEN